MDRPTEMAITRSLRTVKSTRSSFQTTNGGAIVAWYDRPERPPTMTSYAQRVDANGASQWTADGLVAVCLAGEEAVLAHHCRGRSPGGASLRGTIVANGINDDNYAQHN
jgi:hypothetical protein